MIEDAAFVCACADLVLPILGELSKSLYISWVNGLYTLVSALELVYRDNFLFNLCVDYCSV